MWNAHNKYRAGDVVQRPDKPGQLVVCKEYPTSDFCSQLPGTPMGDIGWATYDGQKHAGSPNDEQVMLSMIQAKEAHPAGDTYEEPSISEMKDLFTDIPLLDGYRAYMGPFVVPLSLVQFKAAFLGDHAPYFLTHV